MTSFTAGATAGATTGATAGATSGAAIIGVTICSGSFRTSFIFSRRIACSFGSSL